MKLHRQAGRTGHLRALSRPVGPPPSRRRSRCSSATREYAGGTCDPLVISWPKGIKARGEVRNQYHHSTDIVPTILEVCGLEMPKVYKGVEQYPLSGVSMRYTFDATPDAPTQKKRQYYAMLGTRGIWEDGWKAVALHAPHHRQGPLRPGPVGALPRGRGPRRVEGPGQGESREAPGADQGLVRGGGEEPGAAARRPHRPGDPRHRAALRRSAPRALHLLSRTRLRSRKASPSTSAAVRTRSWPTSRSPTRTAPA